MEGGMKSLHQFRQRLSNKKEEIGEGGKKNNGNSGKQIVFQTPRSVPPIASFLLHGYE